MEERTLVVTLTVTETIRNITEYLALHTTSGITAPLQFVLSNFLNLIVITILARFFSDEDSIVRRIFSFQQFWADVRFATPIGLQLVGALIYFVALRFSSPYLIQAFMVLQIPAAAIANHLLFNEERNTFAWSSVTWLSLGLLIAKLPSRSFSVAEWSAAIIAGPAIAICSALSMIESQKLLKSGSFREAQFRLYAWGTILSIVAYPSMTACRNWGTSHTVHFEDKQTTPTYFISAIFLGVSTGVVGLVMNAMLRRRDSTTYVLGGSGGLLLSSTILNSSSVFLQRARVSKWSTLGCVMILVSIWLYHKYKTPFCFRDSVDQESQERTYHQVPFEDISFISEDEDADTSFSSGQDTETDVFMSKETFMEIVEDESPTSLAAGELVHALTFGLACRASMPKSSSILSAIGRFLRLLVPSFIKLGRTEESDSRKKVPPTAFLDGIRGCAAIGVVIFHTLDHWLPNTSAGWNGTTQKSWIQLPWARLLVSGNAMVSIFFIVSGFSLSYGPLRHVRSRKLDKFASSMASSVLRRHVRLLLPIAVLTFIIMLLIHVGLDQGGSRVPVLPIQDQLRQWYDDISRFSNPMRGIDTSGGLSLASGYAAATWTIPIEIRGSMVVYTLLIGTSRLASKARMLLLTGIAAMFCYYLYWDLALFVMGIVLAEMHLAQEESQSSSHVFQGIAVLAGHDDEARGKASRLMTFLENSFWICNFLLATYILSIPCMTRPPLRRGELGYVFIWSLTPTQYALSWHWNRFWPAVGAVYLLAVVSKSKLLQAPFASRLARYLGFISFAIYLIHLPIVEYYGSPMLAQVWAYTGPKPSWEFWIGFFAVYIGLGVVVWWLSDVFTRVVDQPCVHLSKWLYEKMLDE